MTIADRRAREKEQRRKAILTSAEKLFAKEGFHSTTMDQVAEETELSKATLYLYFQNKDDLFFSVLTERLDTHLKELEKRLGSAASLEDAVQEFVTTQMAFFEKHRHYFVLSVSEQCKIEKTPGSNLRHVFLEKQMAFVAMVERTLSRNMSSSHSERFSPRALALCLIGSTHAHTMNWLMEGSQHSLNTAGGEINQIILHALTD